MVKEAIDVMSYLGGLFFFVATMIMITAVVLFFLLSNKVEKMHADLEKDLEKMDGFYDES